VYTGHALWGFQENTISTLLLFDVTRHAFKVAP
jgi:hypothetical protein